MKPARLSWKVLNAAPKGVADIDVYDVIGDPWGEGPSAGDFVKEVRALNVARINLHVNSPGGYVNDAIAMYNALLSHPAHAQDGIYAYVEGTADSAASFLIQAANHRIIAKNSSMTIHDGMALALGAAADMRALADQLDAESENIASIYADRCGGTSADWRERMQASTGNRGSTYRGQAAVDIGLCDEVGLPMTNVFAGRVAAMVTPEPEEKEPFDLSLIPPLATGYKPPLPTDFTRLLKENIKGA